MGKLDMRLCGEVTLDLPVFFSPAVERADGRPATSGEVFEDRSPIDGSVVCRRRRRQMAVVKSRRRYDSRARKAQAARNRDTALDAAERLFLENGYAGTSIASIAQEAGLSVQTIYKVFGSKSGLVKAIYFRGLLGKGNAPAYERSDAMREREVDPRRIMRQ